MSDLKNNNKKVLKRIAISSLKSSKMRNIFILITIVLSVSLLTGIALLDDAFNVRKERELQHVQHVIYHNVSDEQLSALESDDEISGIRLYKNGTGLELGKNIIIPYYTEQKTTEMSNVKIAEGCYPETINEVLVDKGFMDCLGLDAVLGQTFEIKFLDGITEKFTVSGYTEDNSVTNMFLIYTSREYAVNGSQLKNIQWNAAARIKNADSMSDNEFLDKIRSIGLRNGVERRNINENNIFVNSIASTIRNLILIIFIGFTLLVISIMVIHSIFYISISERTRQFGQLRTLGVTRKQVKKIVGYEAKILCLIGAPIGLLIGSVFAYAMVPQGFSLIHFLIYCTAILLADYVTLCLAVRKPAKIAAKTSPIEATKISGYEMSSIKNSNKLKRSLSPISLSMIAARGNRKKSMMTMISLAIAGVLFVLGCTVLVSMDREQFSRQSTYKYGEFNLYFSSNVARTTEHKYTGLKIDNPLNESLASEIMKIDGVNEVKSIAKLDITYEYNNISSNDSVLKFTKDQESILKDNIRTGVIDYDSMTKNKEVIILYNDVADEIFGWKFKVGDKILMRWFNGEKTVEDYFTIVAELKYNLGYMESFEINKLNGCFFIMPEELVDSMMVPGFNLTNEFIISTDFEAKGRDVEKALNELVEKLPVLKMETLYERLEYDDEAYDRLMLVVLGASLFIIAFSLINLINTIVTNIMGQRHEFSVLQSIGMTSRQIALMIQGEGLYLIIYNIIITFVVGLLGGYGMIEIFKFYNVDYMIYKFPTLYFIGYCILVIVVPIIISAIVIKILNKQSLIERINEVE